MAKMKYSLIFIISFIVAFVVPCFSYPSDISSCLIRHNVYNFTLPYSPDYNTLLNFSLQNLRYAGPTDQKPVAIVIPQSLDQLVDSMLCCRKGAFEFRVRSGGHSYEGISSVDTNGKPFVIIDMMSLSKVWVDVESETAWVEGGATLGETYYAIANASSVHGFSAGRCPTVGVGGHISGGGYGLLTRKYGLAADNVVDALLIDASGKVLDREAMGEDLFWAIRGGGGGVWGIVYAWKIKLLKVPETVTACTMTRPGGKRCLAELLHKWQFAAPKLDPSFHLSVFVGAGSFIGAGSFVDDGSFTSKKPRAVFKGLYLGSADEAMSILDREFPELDVEEEECQEMSWIESVLYFSDLPLYNSSISDLTNRYLKDKVYLKFKSDYVRTPIPMDGLEIALDILKKEPHGHVAFYPYGGEMDNISSDAIPFPHRKGNLFIIHYIVASLTGWSSKYLDWIRGFNESMTPYVSKDPRAAYVNFVDLDLGQMNSSVHYDDPVKVARAWGEKYFLKNYDRLVEVKTRFDRENLFNHPQGIPPARYYYSDTCDQKLGESVRICALAG